MTPGRDDSSEIEAPPISHVTVPLGPLDIEEVGALIEQGTSAQTPGDRASIGDRVGDLLDRIRRRHEGEAGELT